MHPTKKYSVLTGKNVIKTVLRIGLRGRSFQRSKVKGFAKFFKYCDTKDCETKYCDSKYRDTL